MRSDYWDILKGLGIIAIVFGHAQVLSMEVYWYHIAIFFFISGFFISEQKCLNYWLFIQNKIKSLWIPFFICNSFFFLLQNVFLYFNLYNNGQEKIEYSMVAQYLDKYTMVQMIVVNFLGNNVTAMSGATWFICPFIVNLLIFGGLIYLNHNKKYKTCLLILECIILFIISLSFIRHQVVLPMHLVLACLLLPITLLGYCLRKFIKDTTLIINIPIWLLIFSFISVYFLKENGVRIALDQYKIYNGSIFLIASITGIVINLYLAKIILRYNYLKVILSYIGKKSYWIMALHFVGFKFVTFAYICLYNKDNILLSTFMIANISLIWKVIYIISGILLPLIIVFLYKHLKSFYNMRYMIDKI